MASLDKEIEVLMLKGEKGYSSYEEAVANGLFVGTLEEWIETFATPDNYITRYEFQKVTQDEYDALEEAGELIPNCYYIITDDDTWEILQDIISRVETLETKMSTAEDDIDALQEDVSSLQGVVGNLDVTVEHMEEDRLLTRILTNENTDTGYHFIGYSSYSWTVNAPNLTNNEYLYVLRGRVRYNSVSYDLAPFIIDGTGDYANTEKTSIQYFVLPSVGLIRLKATYQNNELFVRAYKIDLSDFTEGTIGDFEFRVESFKAVANWK